MMDTTLAEPGRGSAGCGICRGTGIAAIGTGTGGLAAGNG
jgi:hypothetical protein